MRLRRGLTYLLVILLLVLGAERLIATRPAWLWRERATADACAVYRSLVAHLSSYGSSVFVGSGTIRFKDTLAAHFGGLTSGETTDYPAPSTFSRYGGAVGGARVGAQEDELVVDTSDYFGEVTSENSVFIRGCSEGGEISFYDGPGPLLVLREALLGSGGVSLWSVSPVGISRDGRYALVYGENFCGYLCGGGEFFLFERRGGKWALAGDSLRWVS